MIAQIQDPSQVASTRRLAGEFAAREGMPQDRIDKLALVTTELATNLLKHAGSGDILVSCFNDSDGIGIELLSLDRGPGMKDVNACLEDGFSTAGSLGHGLGSIRRQSDQLRIYSRPGAGTVVSVRFVVRPASPGTMLHCGAAVAPHPSETVCGDHWTLVRTKPGPLLLMADGSGHGPEARRAAELAETTLLENPEDTSEELMARIHRALTPTRGAAVAIARVDAPACRVCYAGVGNISSALVANGRVTRMVSQNGIAGHVAPRIREFTYGYNSLPLVIMHSDGIGTKWDLASYPGLVSAHPALLAGVLFRDFRRGRDDASIVAVRVMV